LNLDDLASIDAGDPSGMLAAVEAWPDQWYEGLERGRAVAPSELPSAKGVDAVVVCGVGGSGIAGDVVRVTAAPRSQVPVVVVRGYELPAFVGHKTLVFCISYSGATDETLACFDAALKRGARIVAVSGAGELAERAAAAGVRVLAPVEGLLPRAAFPSLALAPLVVLERLGLTPGLGPELEKAQPFVAGLASELRRDVPESQNEAKLIARALDGYAVHVWGTEGPLALAAERWKTQLNENAKLPASAAQIPELAHNEVVGYDPGHPNLDRTALVILAASTDDPRIERVRAAAAEVAASRTALITQVPVPGDGALERLVAAVLLGDFVSVYLALLRGVDPSSMEAITRIKQALRE
jgi:glucose/mannose-6-phosphate isomerase